MLCVFIDERQSSLLNFRVQRMSVPAGVYFVYSVEEEITGKAVVWPSGSGGGGFNRN